jgi:hypothetical protein
MLVVALAFQFLSGETLLEIRTVVKELMLRVSSMPSFWDVEGTEATWPLCSVDGDPTSLFICEFDLCGRR